MIAGLMFMKHKTCKNCLYYTGVRCHGHGEYWGECQLLCQLYNELEKTFDNWLDSDLDCWKLVCYDDTICKFYEILKEKVYVKKDSNNN